MNTLLQNLQYNSKMKKRIYVRNKIKIILHNNKELRKKSKIYETEKEQY